MRIPVIIVAVLFGFSIRSISAQSSTTRSTEETHRAVLSLLREKCMVRISALEQSSRWRGVPGRWIVEAFVFEVPIGYTVRYEVENKTVASFWVDLARREAGESVSTTQPSK